MARAGMSLTADAIRIEDAVWDDAFQTRVPSRRRRIIDRDVTRVDRDVTNVDRDATVVDRDVIHVDPDLAHREMRQAADSSWMADWSLSGELSDWLAPSPEDAASFPRPTATTAIPVAAHAPQMSSPDTPPARRTVKIQGRGAERDLPWSGQTARRRPSRAIHERAGFRPDRLAMWAVFLGLLLVLVAALSGHG